MSSSLFRGIAILDVGAGSHPTILPESRLVLSLMVFEHVKPLTTALENIYAYPRPGGALVAYMSGALALFALAKRILPTSVARVVLEKIVGKDPATVSKEWAMRGDRRTLRRTTSCKLEAFSGGALTIVTSGHASRARTDFGYGSDARWSL